MDAPLQVEDGQTFIDPMDPLTIRLREEVDHTIRYAPVKPRIGAADHQVGCGQDFGDRFIYGAFHSFKGSGSGRSDG